MNWTLEDGMSDKEKIKVLEYIVSGYEKTLEDFENSIRERLHIDKDASIEDTIRALRMLCGLRGSGK